MKTTHQLLIGGFVVVAFSLLGNTQSGLDERSQEVTQTMLKSYIGWPKISTPEASIEVRKVARRGPIVQYHLFVHGLPTDRLYQSQNWPINRAEPAVTMEGISIGKDGILMCAGRTKEQCGSPSQKDDPIEFTFQAAKGEPYRLAFVSGDSRVATVIVPDPIEGKDRGCTLNLVRLLPKFELAYLSGEGFPANTEVQFHIESYGEKHQLNKRTDESGKFGFALLPNVSGHDKGTTSIKTFGKQCSPSLKFDWG